jgi:catalase
MLDVGAPTLEHLHARLQGQAAGRSPQMSDKNKKLTTNFGGPVEALHPGDVREGSSQLQVPPVRSDGEWQEQPDFKEPPLDLHGAADHWDARKDDDDYYTQPGMLFRLIAPEKQKLLFENTARNLGPTTEEVKLRHIGNCYQADPAYGEGVAAALGIPMSKIGK